CSLKPAKLVYVSDVPGLLSDPGNPASLIPSVTPEAAERLIDSGVVSGGMIPKIRSALDALRAGVD
ncbi:MAG: acetylglutamate kinase, partial [Akkermansiaceae bacterium]|nr:acetylglutamate kinase [Akkermansiaceae bacterium]